MNVDRPARTPDKVIKFPGQSDSVDGIVVELDDDPKEDLTGTGIVAEGINDNETEPEKKRQDFSDNVAEILDETELNCIAKELTMQVDEDIQGRSDWFQIYKDNLNYLGLKEEKRSQPWQGACGATYPMMLESIVRFQSRAMAKLYPNGGPIKLNLPPSCDPTVDIQKELQRAQLAVNEWITDEMPEHRLETDRLLFAQGEIGYAVKKLYDDPRLGRVVTQFVKAEDFVIPYGTNNLETAPRFTEIVARAKSEVESLVKSGVYCDRPLKGVQQSIDEVEQAKAYLTGQEPSPVLDDTMRFYEIYADFYIGNDPYADEDEKPSPYIVTIEKDTQDVFNVRRNWDQNDHLRKKLMNFVQYIYVPGEGNYGYGLVQLTGQLTSSATKILRQLIDAGTLANLPAAFRSRAARMKSQDPLAPGELREVNIDPEQLAKAFFQLPFKEPSVVLFQLMEKLVEEGKVFASTADLDISASSQNAPVGTTLALIERNMEIANAVMGRLYASFRAELRLWKSLLKRYYPEIYEKLFGKIEQLAGGEVGILPIGDPSSSTLSERVIRLQAVTQMSAQAPQVFDMSALYRSLISAMGLPDADLIVPDKTKLQPMSPVEENMGFMTGKPTKAFEWQDHKAHISIHTALLNDPYYIQSFGQSPMAQQIAMGLQSHIAEHQAFDYFSQIEQQLGVKLPPLGQPQSPEIDSTLSSLVAQAAGKVAQQHAAEVQQQAAQKQQADPAYQLEKQDLGIKEFAATSKDKNDKRKLDIEEKAHADKKEIEIMRIRHSTHAAEMNSEDKSKADESKKDSEMLDHAVKLGHRMLDHGEHLNTLDHQEKISKESKNNKPSK